ncbi:hypothetical protein BG53_04800 [Paenibacillus darwinianus]|uniref:Uncharacterized protein n=1 Tax=Paenibacillus darwinianus TaxID=1380763 RepID=A0A9W5W6M2_9BACL|nr:hypothetical protein BG53_04800 [Paenibacillus darwinianus]EXX88595.1 hypothetical protein CH50_03065 [Paenibacillus darwinianus]
MLMKKLLRNSANPSVRPPAGNQAAEVREPLAGYRRPFREKADGSCYNKRDTHFGDCRRSV